MKNWQIIALAAALVGVGLVVYMRRRPSTRDLLGRPIPTGQKSYAGVLVNAPKPQLEWQEPPTWRFA